MVQHLLYYAVYISNFFYASAIFSSKSFLIKNVFTNSQIMKIFLETFLCFHFDMFFTNLPYFYLKDFLQFWPKIIQQFYSISYFPNKFLLYCFFLVYNWYTPNYIKATFFLVKDRSKLCLLRMYYAGKKI